MLNGNFDPKFFTLALILFALMIGAFFISIYRSLGRIEKRLSEISDKENLMRASQQQQKPKQELTEDEKIERELDGLSEEEDELQDISEEDD